MGIGKHTIMSSWPESEMTCVFKFSQHGHLQEALKNIPLSYALTCMETCSQNILRLLVPDLRDCGASVVADP